MRVDLPPNLGPEEKRAILAALERYLSSSTARPSAWALAGRAGNLGLGALQIRHQAGLPWSETRLNPYTRLGMETRMGRGDAK